MEFEWYPQYMDPEANAQVQNFLLKKLIKHKELYLMVLEFLQKLKDTYERYTHQRYNGIDGGRTPKQPRTCAVRADLGCFSLVHHRLRTPERFEQVDAVRDCPGMRNDTKRDLAP